MLVRARQLAVLNRISQIHGALVSIVEACRQRVSSTPADEDGGEGPGHTGRGLPSDVSRNGNGVDSRGAHGSGAARRDTARASADQQNGGVSGQGSGDGGGRKGSGSVGARPGDGPGAGAGATGKAEASVVMREDGTVVLERSQACLRVSEGGSGPRRGSRFGSGWRAPR